MRQVLSLAVLLTVACLGGAALADVPPPPGYVEQCTVAKQQKRGAACVSCGDAYHGDRDACERSLAPQGYERRCKTRGASVWTEVWCRPAAAAPTEPTPKEEGKSAQVQPAAPADAPAPARSFWACGVGSPQGAWGAWALALLALGWLRLRRRLV